MPVIINGNPLTSLLEIQDANLTIDRAGGVKSTVVYNIRWELAKDAVMALRNHPYFPELTKDTVSMEREDACIARVSVVFKGTFRDTGVSYTVRGSTSGDPIETHPKFTTDFGGEPPEGGGTNSKGAKFDEDGKFLGFVAPKEVDGNKYAPYEDLNRVKSGVRSFLNAGFVYTETKIYNSARRAGIDLDANTLGEIDDSVPNSDALPEFPEGRDWLLIQFDVDEWGEGLRVTKSWRLSGPRGWDVDIYRDLAD